MKLANLIEQKLTIDLEQIEDLELVKDIQFNLVRIGYQLKVDGIVGPRTTLAWAKFKKDNYLGEPDKIGESSAIALLREETIEKKFALPTNGIGWVSSPFGPRGKGNHNGIDIACNEDTPIFAIADGIINFAVSGCNVGDFRCGGGYGNCIYLKHQGMNFDETRYAHLSRLAANVRIGESVSMGELIGYNGNTGHSFGAHLHFEVRVNGKPKNPLSFFNPIV